jgi:hypothetical protein
MAVRLQCAASFAKVEKSALSLKRTASLEGSNLPRLHPAGWDWKQALAVPSSLARLSSEYFWRSPSNARRRSRIHAYRSGDPAEAPVSRSPVPSLSSAQSWTCPYPPCLEIFCFPETCTRIENAHKKARHGIRRESRGRGSSTQQPNANSGATSREKLRLMRPLSCGSKSLRGLDWPKD